MSNLYTEKNLIKNPYSFIAVNKYIPPHKHEFWEFTFSLEHPITHFINGQKICCLPKNNIILIKPGDTHEIRKENYYLHQDIYVEDAKMRTICDLINSSLYNKLSTNDEPIVIDVQYFDMENIIKSLQNFFSFSKDVSYNETYLSSLHTAIICQILGIIYKNKLSTGTNYPDWIKDFFSKLKEEKYLCKSLKDILNEIHYSREYLCHIFKKYTNKTMSQCLCEAKVAYSIILLSDKSLSVLQIAMRLNYSSQCAYISAFKKLYKMPPSQYRKKYLFE